MLLKVLAVVSLLLLPLSAMVWRKSHNAPEVYRCDLTEYKSLRVSLTDGTCGLRLLSMPLASKIRSEFRTSLSYNPIPNQRSFMLSSVRQGPFRVTWLVFPLWFSTFLLSLVSATPVVLGPIRKWWRRERGLCEECGYDLRGSRSGRCSECGTRYRK